MYKIINLYIVSGNSIESYTIEKYTPVQFMDKATSNIRLYIAVEYEEEDKIIRIGMNFGRMVTDRLFSNVITWNDVVSMLTEEMILGYTDTIPGYDPGSIHPREQVVTWDVMNYTNTFHVQLYDYRSGSEPRIKQNAEDLYITIRPEATNYPDLKKCIPVVNGYACRPIQHNDGIIAKGAAALFWNSPERMTPEVQLLDFSNIGDVYIVPVNKDNVIYGHGVYQININHLSLKYNTYIPVVNGMMILPDKYTTKSNNSVIFDLNKTTINVSNSYRSYLVGNHPSKSYTAYQSDSIDEHVNNQLNITLPDLTDDFTIVVTSPYMYVSRTKLDVWRNGFLMNLHAEEGILFNDKIGIIMDYHCQELVDRKELTVQYPDSMYLADNLHSDRQLVFVEPDKDTDKLFNIHGGDCTMVYLMK